MAVQADSVRATMRHWVSGVTVVTAATRHYRAGVTASSFTSVSLDPPMVLVCLQNTIETFRLIVESGHFAISILRTDQANWSRQFAGFVPLPEGADRFYGVEVMTAVTGAPILTEAAGWFDCKLHGIQEAGISRIVMGEVLATGHRDGAVPLVYHNREYFDLIPQQSTGQ